MGNETAQRSIPEIRLGWPAAARRKLKIMVNFDPQILDL
jgi:hypothetical protein